MELPAHAGGLFRPLPGGRKKDRGLGLFETCARPEARREALAEFARVGARTAGGSWRRDLLVQALRQQRSHDLGVRWEAARRDWVKGREPASVEEQSWVQRAQGLSGIEPRLYAPPHTHVGGPDRHPWHGEVGELTFGELAAGIGVFAAAFRSVGMRCQYWVEPNKNAHVRTRVNAGVGAQAFDSLSDVDPAALPWAHVLVAGPE